MTHNIPWPSSNSSEQYSKLLKGVKWGTMWETTLGLLKEDTRSLDYGSSEVTAKSTTPKNLTSGKVATHNCGVLFGGIFPDASYPRCVGLSCFKGGPHVLCRAL